MDQDSYLNAVRAALGSRGFELSRAVVAGRPADAGRRSDFRWTWFWSRLHTSVLVASFPAGEGRAAPLDAFLEAASRWAVANRRGSRFLGFQSGTAAVAVAVFPDGAGEAAAWAQRSHGQHYAALAYPVAVDLRSGRVTQPGRMIVGGVFARFLRRVVRDTVEAPLRG